MSHQHVMVYVSLIAGLLFAETAYADIDESIMGTYRFIGGSRQRNNVDRQRQKSISSFNAFLRPIARRALRKSCIIPARIIIERQGDLTGIQLTPLPMRRSPLNGTLVRFNNSDGHEVRMQRRVRGGDIVEIAQFRRGRRSLVYHFEGQRLQLRWTIDSNLLPNPISYVLSYSR